MQDSERERRLRLMAALDNVQESYDLLKESFDAAVCLDLLEWLQISQNEIEAWQAVAGNRRIH